MQFKVFSLEKEIIFLGYTYQKLHFIIQKISQDDNLSD